jgi:hypothetical protein
MATEIGSLLIDMRADVARLAQDMAKAQNTVEGAMKNVQRSASAAVTALGLIGVGVSVAGMANVVKGAVGAMAALDDMAAKAGTTVENMSALADVAKIGGHDLSVVEGAMVRLTKALAGGDDEAKGAGHALAALGLNAEKLRSMDTAEAMLVVAQALDQYGDGAGKTALMLDLLGKSGAAAIPYLQDLAEKGRLNASVTTEQAAAAERLEKDINAVRLEGDKMTRAMVANMLPTMGNIAKAMRQAAEDGGTLKALFVGFGGLANEFVTPWKAAFLGLGAGLNEMLATFEDGLAKVTFGGVAERHRKAALDYREAARAMNLEIAALDKRGGPGAPGEKKPDLNYKKPPGGGREKTKTQEPIDVFGSGSYITRDKDTAEAIRASFEFENWAQREFVKDAATLDKLREKYVAMADPLQQYRVQLDEINMLREKGVLTADLALEAEWAVNEAMDKTIDKLGEVKDAGKDTFAELTSAVESWGNKAADAFADFVVDGKGSFTDLVNSMLKDIVRLQAKQMLDPITKGASGFLTDILGGLFKTTAAVQHGGGIVGFEQAGFRDLSPAIFSGAPRLHGGGIAGDEMPAILQKGEGVFTRGQMAALGGGAGASEMRIEIVNPPGRPAEVASANPRFDPDGVVISIILQDINRGGPIASGMEQQYGLNRVAGAR